MELPDFLEFDAFNELRDRMGADKLGYFEVFDPKRHLTGEERAELRLNGVPVVRSQVQFLGDHTLAYKDSRIGLVVDGVLHITRCNKLDDFHKGLVVSSQAAAEASTSGSDGAVQQEDEVSYSSGTAQPFPSQRAGRPMSDFGQDVQRNGEGNGLNRPNGKLSVCPDCLHQLRFEGLDLDKERKHHHNQKILRDFDLARFFAIYPDYPLYERTHVRHPF